MILTTRAASLPLALVLAIPLPVDAQLPAAPQVPATPATLQPPAPPATLQPPANPTAPQPPAPPRTAQERGPRSSLDVQVVIVRSRDDKVISRLPYSLEVTTGMPESQLNIGTEVPVPITAFSPARAAAPKPQSGGQPALPAAPADAPVGPLQPVSYKSVGTVLSCRAANAEGGQYELVLSVDDNAVLPSDAAPSGSPDLPVFRAFRARNTLVLRDGQTRTFTAAADRVSGEMVRVEVTLRVLKN